MTIVTLETRSPEKSAVDTGEIITILSALGGAAHLSVIHSQLRAGAASKRLRDAPTLSELRRTLIAHRNFGPETTDDWFCFFQPYGEESYRWGLCKKISADPDQRIGAQA